MLTKEINTINIYEMRVDYEGVFIVSFVDELERKIYREKVLFEIIYI